MVYHKPPVESEQLKYLSADSMAALIKLIEKAKNAIGQPNEQAVLSEFNTFIDSLTADNELVNIS